MKKVLLFTVLSFIGFNTMAQFPGAGMGGGQRQQPQQQAIPGTAQAAPKGSAKIVGFVIDSAATKAVEFASVALINKATNKPVDGTVADEKGKFTLNKIATGDYVISVSFLGYVSKRIPVKIQNKNIKKEKISNTSSIELQKNKKYIDPINPTETINESKLNTIESNNSKTEIPKFGKKIVVLTTDTTFVNDTTRVKHKEKDKK